MKDNSHALYVALASPRIKAGYLKALGPVYAKGSIEVLTRVWPHSKSSTGAIDGKGKVTVGDFTITFTASQR